jgi:hypothetical protein
MILKWIKKKTECQSVDCSHLAQGRDKLKAVVEV